jgi:hypothetical protein
MPQKAGRKELNDKWINRVTRPDERHERSNTMPSEILTVTFLLLYSTF